MNSLSFKYLGNSSNFINRFSDLFFSPESKLLPFLTAIFGDSLTVLRFCMIPLPLTARRGKGGEIERRNWTPANQPPSISLFFFFSFRIWFFWRSSWYASSPTYTEKKALWILKTSKHRDFIYVASLTCPCWHVLFSDWCFSFTLVWGLIQLIIFTRRVSLKQILKLQLEGEKCRICGLFFQSYTRGEWRNYYNPKLCFLPHTYKPNRRFQRW